jgi:DNA-binding NarL/FixJ family response regulator
MNGPGNVRILLVDDQVQFRAAARELLEARGHAVAEGGNRGEALALIAGFGPDAALVDVRLRDDTGAAVTRALLDVAPGLTVVLMSADTIDLRIPAVRDCGAHGFILKRWLVATDLARLFERR